jgi:hypothetical protein
MVEHWPLYYVEFLFYFLSQFGKQNYTCHSDLYRKYIVILKIILLYSKDMEPE